MLNNISPCVSLHQISFCTPLSEANKSYRQFGIWVPMGKLPTLESVKERGLRLKYCHSWPVLCREAGKSSFIIMAISNTRRDPMRVWPLLCFFFLTNIACGHSSWQYFEIPICRGDGTTPSLIFCYQHQT